MMVHEFIRLHFLPCYTKIRNREFLHKNVSKPSDDDLGNKFRWSRSKRMPI